MRSPRIALTVAAVVSLSTVGAAGVPACARQQADEASSPNGNDRERFVGTYRLVTTEVKDASGTWSQAPHFNRFGYITYSDTGHMGVTTMEKNRTRFAGDQPTPEEAQTVLGGDYRAYYGPYTVHEEEQFVVHHRAGQINPGGEVDGKRFYDFVGNQLILTPAPASGGKEQATRHIVWERLPDAQLSAEATRFVGVRQLLYTDRYTEKDGSIVTHGETSERRAGSYIIYTPTGHMMVQLMDKEGRTPYAGETPTPEEALAAYRSYGGYFGRFTVYENDDPQYVVHNQEGRLNPGTESDAQRFYQLDGDILRLGGPPRTTDGETTGGHLYWEMLPPPLTAGTVPGRAHLAHQLTGEQRNNRNN